MYDYCIMIVCNIGPAWRHDCTHEAKPMTTYCTQHFDPYKKTTTGKPTSKMTPKKTASQGPPWLQVFLPPPVVHKRRLAVLFVAELVGRSSCWAGVCIFNNVPLANVSTVAPAPVSGKPTSPLSHHPCYSHTHSAKTLVQVVNYQWVL